MLTESDVHDVKDFCCANQMDFIAVSFVQTADDVRTVRRVLAEGGACAALALFVPM